MALVLELQTQVAKHTSAVDILTRQRERAEALAEERNPNAGHFLVRLVAFNRAALEFGSSLNLTAGDDPRLKKGALAKRLLTLLAEIDRYDGMPEEDPVKAKNALIRYQEAKDFGTTGFFGSDTYYWMVRDHIELDRGA